MCKLKNKISQLENEIQKNRIKCQIYKKQLNQKLSSTPVLASLVGASIISGWIIGRKGYSFFEKNYKYIHKLLQYGLSLF